MSRGTDPVDGVGGPSPERSPCDGASRDNRTESIASEVFESVLALAVSTEALIALFKAGVSGLEGRSDDARGLEAARSLPLFTALASRSCKRELGLLREELLRDRAEPEVSQKLANILPLRPTYLNVAGGFPGCPG